MCTSTETFIVNRVDCSSSQFIVPAEQILVGEEEERMNRREWKRIDGKKPEMRSRKRECMLWDGNARADGSEVKGEARNNARHDRGGR